MLGYRFITKYGTKQGVIVLSKQVSLGIGAALGVDGDYIFGRFIVALARRIFGPAADAWPQPDSGRHADDRTPAAACPATEEQARNTEPVAARLPNRSSGCPLGT